MLGWLYRIIIGHFTSCKHEWGILRYGGIYENKKSSRPFAIDYDLQCTKRGDVKSRWL